MKKQKVFQVFGETVEILVTAEMSEGSVSVGVQVSPPGGGPAPHIHDRENEFFTVIEGEFDVLSGEEWHHLRAGESHYVPKGTIHAFRNCGANPGRMLVAVAPGGIEAYLEKLSAYSLPEDIDAVKAVSEEYGTHLLI
jgi:mannose-6-phosphate isomerase-like protein (cupin superfamily)